MKKGFLSLLLVSILSVGISLPVRAESYQGKSGWHVAFDGQKMNSNFKTADLDEAVSGLQPGDNIVFKLSLENEYSETTDWWMTNKVLHSLEDGSANSRTHGGAYTYILTYTDKAGEEVTLFSSDTVGGENISIAGEGLHEATDAMEDYFYLDTLDTGQSGTIRLEVALDGETQGNDYQDTLADLQMNFAVELNGGGNDVDRRWETDSGSSSRRIRSGGNGSSDSEYERILLSETSSNSDSNRSGDIVRTGDDTNQAPYYIAMAVSGALILALAVYSRRQGKKEKEEE